jgi:hypothetical protein
MTCIYVHLIRLKLFFKVVTWLWKESEPDSEKNQDTKNKRMLKDRKASHI